jgi:hypothetical protein
MQVLVELCLEILSQQARIGFARSKACLTDDHSISWLILKLLIGLRIYLNATCRRQRAEEAACCRKEYLVAWYFSRHVVNSSYHDEPILDYKIIPRNTSSKKDNAESRRGKQLSQVMAKLT